MVMAAITTVCVSHMLTWMHTIYSESGGTEFRCTCRETVNFLTKMQVIFPPKEYCVTLLPSSSSAA